MSVLCDVGIYELERGDMSGRKTPVQKARDTSPNSYAMWDDPRMEAKAAMCSVFIAAWREYLRIDASVGNAARDILKGRRFVENVRSILTRRARSRGEFYTAGHIFVKQAQVLGLRAAAPEGLVLPCLQALTCFVKFLTWDNSTRFVFKGLRDSVRDVYNNRNFEFKQQWTRALRSMVDWVRTVYPEAYLQALPGVDYADIRRRVAAAEAEVQTESERLKAVAKTAAVADVSAKTKRGRGAFDRFNTAEVEKEHVLGRMRGLLAEL